VVMLFSFEQTDPGTPRNCAVVGAKSTVTARKR
jgi:hypothetical protein